MTRPEDTEPEIDLDPQNWDAFADVAHQAVDDVVQQLAGLRDRPPWQPVSEPVAADLDEPLPEDGRPLEDVYEQARRSILPYPTGNVHPRFWGWVMGNGTAEGALADFIASGMNSHLAGYDQSAVLIERKVLAWLAEMMGYPESAGGILVSGGTVANFNGIAVARKAKATWDLREDGLYGGPRMRYYGSDETHGWAERAADWLGLGRGGFVRIPSDAEHRLDLDTLKTRIETDREAGELPFCVVGNAGTVNAGAIDDLDALADLCRDENLWFHVDGAFGALAALSPKLRPLLKGMERSDSLAFDLHKWGYLQYEIGCTLVRSRDLQQGTFASSASYLKAPGRGIQPTALEFSEMGLQLSRGFRALKAWMAFKHHGVRKIGRVIEQNVEQARYLKTRVEAEPGLEVTAPVPLNVVCFRACPQGLTEAELDELNREILIRLQEDGVAIPSSTLCDGRFALRVAITNHRSKREDFDLLVDSVLDLCREISATNR